MFKQPSHPSAIPIVTVIVVVFVLLYAVMALWAMQSALHCGPACSALMGALRP